MPFWAVFAIVVGTGLSLTGCSGSAGGVNVWDAVDADDASAIETFAKAGGDVNVRAMGGKTPLWVAFDEGKRNAYEALLKNGADPNVTISGNMIVTHLTAHAEDISWLKLALDHGADPNLPSGSNMGTVLHFVIGNGEVNETDLDVDKAKLLIAHGADMNKPDQFGSDPLAAAGATRKFKIVLCLLEHGADYKHSTQGWRTFQEKVRQAYKGRASLRQEQDRNDLDAVVAWLKGHGMELEKAE